MQYPARQANDWTDLSALSAVERVRLYFRDANRRKRGNARRRGIDLKAVRFDTTALAHDDLVLMCVLRNAVKYLPSYLSHYRRLGVKRFAFVDDQSNDGTREWLLAEDGVDVFESTARFGTSDLGLVWRDMLVDIYGRSRWYVSIDSDEYLVFPDSERRPLGAFIDDLRRHGLTRSFAVMIDIYPDSPIGQASRHEPPTAFPTTVCPLYDTSTYSLANSRIGSAVRGGPRRRMFDQNFQLTKFPVIYVDDRTQFSGAGSHAPLPLQRNFGQPSAVLLHYKFNADAIQSFRQAAGEGQYWRGSESYNRIVNHEAFNDSFDLRYEGSARFESSLQLVDTGFMRDLRASRPP